MMAAAFGERMIKFSYQPSCPLDQLSEEACRSIASYVLGSALDTNLSVKH